jgi:hypothetical protein
MKKLSRNQIKNKIIAFVTNKNGCKAIEVCTDEEIAVSSYPIFPELIEELRNEGKLCEVAYVLPTIPYRIKSFLLPIGTLVSTKNPGNLQSPTKTRKGGVHVSRKSTQKRCRIAN